jgi:tRNA nucleotidyltransferase/poly(A) polymerase
MKINLNEIDNDQLKAGLALAKKITEVAPKAEAYLVGGCVRDMVRFQLGQTSELDIHDIDIATSLPLETLKKQFRTCDNNGEKHGTILVWWSDQYFEVTHFRTDGDYSDGRHPDEVILTESFEEDTARRDFTINALGLAWDGEVIDYHGGVDDIKNKIIRAVGDPSKRFEEDALRMIRGARFAVNFNYSIENNTSDAISKNAARIANVSNERIRAEFLKITNLENIPDFIDRLIWVGLIKHIKGFEGMDYYEVKGKLIDCDDLLTKDNLFPAICYTAHDESNLEAFVPTREERKLWTWLRSYDNVYAWTPESGKHWTSLVNFVSGEYELLLALNADYYCERAWLDQLPTACYLLHNEPNRKYINDTVSAMGIAPGKEFGIKASELLEAEYAKMAAAFPNHIEIKMGNSTLVYKIESVK